MNPAGHDDEPFGIHLDEVERMLRLLREQSHISEIRVNGRGLALHAVALPAASSQGSQPAAADPPSAAEVVHRVTAKQVGYVELSGFDLSPGVHVEQGATMLRIHSLGISTPVVAEEEGWVRSLLVAEGDAVEWGQALVELSAAPPGEERANQ